MLPKSLTQNRSDSKLLTVASFWNKRTIRSNLAMPGMFVVIDSTTNSNQTCGIWSFDESCYRQLVIIFALGLLWATMGYYGLLHVGKPPYAIDVL